MQLGIIGLPASGKTTVFNALTGSQQPTHAAGSGKMEIHTAVVNVPDPRLDALADLLGPPKKIPAQITCVDIGGLSGSSQGAELSGQLRNKLEQMDGLIHVVRAFEDAAVPHPSGHLNPQRDLDTLDSEFVLADLILVENRLARVKEDLTKGKKEERPALQREEEVLEHLRAALEEGTLLRDLDLPPSDMELLRGYGLLTLKPAIVVLNLKEELRDPSEFVTYDHATTAVLAMRGRLEMDLAQLDTQDVPDFMAEYGLTELARDRVVRESYKVLGFQTFFTFNEEEVRAWAIPVGASALQAAAAIHTDIARGFIRAEVAACDTLLQAGGWSELKSAGKLQVEGKDYLMRDGDVMLIRFNV